MPLRDALDRAVEALTPDQRDAAAVAYAELLADEIDRAAAIERAADRALREARAEQGEDSFVYEQLSALRAKLGRREVLDRLGQRFHNVLTELKATPKARAGDPAAVTPTGPTKLDLLRGGA